MFTGYDVEKKLREKARRMSILEVGEREGLAARGQGALKSLVTTEDSTLRNAYGHLATTERFPNILTATTNNMEILTDSSSRRDPVIRIPDGWRIDLAVLIELLPQLWAQACIELDRGDFDDPTTTYGKAVRLPREMWGAMLEDSDQHKQNSPTYEALNQALNVLPPAAAAVRVTALSVQNVLKAHGLRVSNQEFSRTMIGLGWEQAPKLKAWGSGRIWQRAGGGDADGWGRPQRPPPQADCSAVSPCLLSSRQTET